MLEDAKEMRAIALKVQKRYKSKKFKGAINEIKQKAKEGKFNCMASFHRDIFTDAEVQAFVNYLTSKGYKVFVDGVHIMRIEW